MGANEFMVVGRGKSAEDAFARAQEEARYEYGHGGYTGTIAEKSAFETIAPPAGRLTGDQKAIRKAAMQYATELLDAGDRRVDDKWGPAGCIALGEGEWLFFGWASS